MDLKEYLIDFQNRAEENFQNSKTLSSTIKYLLAIFVFMASTGYAGLTMPFRIAYRKLTGKKRSSVVLELDKDNLSEVLQQNEWVLLDFWADWCGPCVLMNKTLDTFASNSPKICIAKVNADNNTDLVQLFKVKGLPQLLLIKDGKEYKRHAGPLTLNGLKEFCQI